MKLLDLTCDDPAMDLAVDEALLDEAEAGRLSDDVLRLWEPRRTVVVIGRSSKVAEEVNAAACQQRGVPVLRRCSGGAAVVGGPGCLMYSVVLGYDRRGDLRVIDHAHEFVLGRVAQAIRRLGPPATRLGISDLTVGDRKVSGNSLRCRRDHVLYHGTLLYSFPLADVAELLGTPPRQPEYRDGRSHTDFVANLNVPVDDLRAALIEAWAANEPLTNWPRAAAERLHAERYSRDEWNRRL
ncbi:MAG: lipoate--protein ligase family protein [Pirellulaceae bacterium]